MFEPRSRQTQVVGTDSDSFIGKDSTTGASVTDPRKSLYNRRMSRFTAGRHAKVPSLHVLDSFAALKGNGKYILHLCT